MGLEPGTELEALEQPRRLLLQLGEDQPSMIKVDGLWVHQGKAEPGADWSHVVDTAREERIQAIPKTRKPGALHRNRRSLHSG